jgi:phosphosulfolactate synthase (CoM biosynthesis protein A)
MKIETVQQLKELLIEDRGLNNVIKSAFFSNYEHASQNSINTANKVAAQYTYDDLISDAFTEDIIYEIDEKKVKEFFINEYGFTLAFIQSGF